MHADRHECGGLWVGGKCVRCEMLCECASCRQWRRAAGNQLTPRGSALANAVARISLWWRMHKFRRDNPGNMLVRAEIFDRPKRRNPNEQ